MPTETTHESVTLYYRQCSSDKIYQTRIEPQGNGFVVNFAYGRRGSTLQTGTKTNRPVDHATAKKTFDKLVAEKTAKGYTPGEDGTPYENTSQEERATGIFPQLLNAIDEVTVEKLIADEDWWAQEKFDGKRVLIQGQADQVVGINRKGLAIALPGPIVQQALQIGGGPWLMDGEAIGDVYQAFDFLEHNGTDYRRLAYSQRLTALYRVLPPNDSAPIRSVGTAIGTKQKRDLLKSLRERNAEGIVFKRHDAPYTSGRPASGGDQLKLKFTATASCIVASANGSKRSVKLELLDAGGKRVNIGNVTIPPKVTIPTAGQIVECRYLYAFVGGSLYQPVYLGVRDDIAADACTVTQLKFKNSDEDDGG